MTDSTSEQLEYLIAEKQAYDKLRQEIRPLIVMIDAMVEVARSRRRTRAEYFMRETARDLTRILEADNGNATEQLEYLFAQKQAYGKLRQDIEILIGRYGRMVEKARASHSPSAELDFQLIERDLIRILEADYVGECERMGCDLVVFDESDDLSIWHCIRCGAEAWGVGQ